MIKEYQENQNTVPKVAEPSLSYGSEKKVQQSSSSTSIIENTMSVDEYFDELISLVRSDYANL
ncbi:MAG: hypothetical protein IKU03_07325 [Bacteroidales bacterium]|nr:hypothetical protein [Bacteroidales bacterium]